MRAAYARRTCVMALSVENFVMINSALAPSPNLSLEGEEFGTPILWL
jgi:hypothetical protein